ncbi:MAG: hypothetical protein ACYCU7_18770 [Acidimicrobiales bacterium]
MKWRGKDLNTVGDLLDAVCKCGSREEAQEFMRLYRAETTHADANIGYISGYCDGGTMQRIQDWCSVAHPIFGRSIPTPEEAFEAGRRTAEAARGGGGA